MFLAPLGVGFLMAGQSWGLRTALGIFVIAAITDFFDGHLSRSMRITSSLGAHLDIVADKVLMTSFLVALNVLGVYPLWLVAILLLREIFILCIVAVMRSVQKLPTVIFPAKIKIVLQSVSIMLGIAALSFSISGDTLTFSLLKNWSVMTMVGALICGLIFSPEHIRHVGLTLLHMRSWKTLIAFWRAARPYHNTQNIPVFLFAAFLAGHDLALSDLVIIISLSAACSAVYVYNSWSDAAFDVHIPRKKDYAASMSILGQRKVYALLAALLSVALGLGAFIGWRYLLVLMLLLVVGYCYSSPLVRWKEKIFFDILCGSTMTLPLRFLAVWFALTDRWPPILPLLLLASIKTATYLIEKNQDRSDLMKLGVRNTTTTLSSRAVVRLSFLCVCLGVFLCVLMLLPALREISWIGGVPLRSLLVGIIILPLPVIGYWYILRARVSPSRILLHLSHTYTLLVSIVLWWILFHPPLILLRFLGLSD